MKTALRLGCSRFAGCRRIAVRALSGRELDLTAGLVAGLRIYMERVDWSYATGRNEEPVQRAIACLLGPGGVFFDVGANIGFFSLLAARLVGPEGAVYAFEPHPDNARILRHNARINGISHLTVVEKAVSAKSGTGHLLVTRHTGGHTLEGVNQPPDRVGRTPVHLVSIDDCMRNEDFRSPSFVKIDVEGAESQVLEGMVQTLRLYRPLLLCELDDATPEALGRKRTELTTLLRKRHYATTLLASSYPDPGWCVEHLLAVPVGT